MTTEQKVTRKLSAILSADVKGYSLLMTNDEVSTIQTLKEYRNIMSGLIKQHSGRVVDAPGDNLLAEFSSVVNAVQCSVEIQNKLKEKNDDLQDDKRLEFRIGVNIGDVVQDGDSLYGEGVNIAARIEGLADPGGVCISKGAYDHIRNKLGFGYEFIGEHTVKNIKQPVSVYKVLIKSEDAGKLIGDEPKPLLQPGSWATIIIAAIVLILIGYQVFQKLTAPEFEPASIENMALPLPDKPSIAVLPFDNMSENKEDDFFSDGISENIITAISKTNKLFVIARNSTFVYKGKSVKIKQIAEELGVRYVLEGSVQKSEDRVRITAQLIDAIGGHHLWAERYDRNLEDIFSLQDEITMKIVTAMRIELTDGEQARMWGAQHKNIDIYLMAMEGNRLYRAFTMDTIERYGQLGQEMIDLDPESSAGYLVRGWYNYRVALLGQSKNPKEHVEKAFKMAQKTISLDESDPFAHILLGTIYSLRREYEKSISEGRRSIELFPNGAMPRGVFASLLCNADMPDEALGHITQAIRLNPSPASWYYVVLGKCYRAQGHFDKALAAFNKALQINPKAMINHVSLAMTYALLDRQDEAEAAAKKVLEINPNFSVALYTKAWPYKNQADLKLVRDAMRKAGLPD